MRSRPPRSRTFLRPVLAAVAALAMAAPVGAQQISSSLLDAFHFRNLGPFRAGANVTAFAVPTTPEHEHLRTYYVGVRNGGVWKTVNNGTTFEPVFDDEPTLSIGALAVAPSDANEVWVGTGEITGTRYSTYGDGVYKSMDAGKTWQHMGLAATQHISVVLVDPRDPNTVYVAAMGHLQSTNPERGVYRTKDGGKTWQKVLYINDHVGVIDLAMDPSNPDILYAATYQMKRLPWTFDLGGPESGIYKTTDGGDHWTRLRNGLPTGNIGRIGIDIFRANPNILYAVVENGNPRPGQRPGAMRVSGGWGQVYRTDDAGASWHMTNPPDVNVGGKAPYSFNVLRVDPKNDQRLYVTSDALLTSLDGGKTWSDYSHQPLFKPRDMFGDVRQVWVDPQDGNHMLIGTDGGVNVTYDGGKTVDFLENIPMGEVYSLALDNDDPYHIYVGEQDHESWKGPVNGFSGVVSSITDWVTMGTGDGMFQAVDPTNSRWEYNTFEFGGQFRVDQKNATMTRIQPPPRPKGEQPYRYTWTTPIVLSPHDPSTVYTAAQVVLRSKDRGDTWQEISPDLTTNDKSKENGSGNIQYCTITTVAESPVTAGVIWAGTDDGNVQVTRDDGAHWTNTTQALWAAGAPKEYWVTDVVPSSHVAGRAYVTITGFQRDDNGSYVYRTDDYGATWTSLGAAPLSGGANAIAEDPHNPSLLFLGTDQGLFTSIDEGAHWVRFKSNIPIVPVKAIAIQAREHDLVVGTYGRAIWQTDITPLEQLTPDVLKQPVHLFEPEAKGLRVESGWGNYHYFGDRHIDTPNEPNGVLIDVYRRDAGGDTLTLTVKDAKGTVVHTLKVAPGAGIHRVLWNLRGEPPAPTRGGRRFYRFRRGPAVDPGTYTVTLTGAGSPRTVDEVVKPRVVVPRPE